MSLLDLLSEDAMAELLDDLERRLAKRRLKEIEAPLSVKKFAERCGDSVDTIYRKIAAGQLRTVPGIGKKKIPASELEKYE